MSPIAGFETYPLVLAQLEALEREVPKSEMHAQAIAAQIALFSEEADRWEEAEMKRVQAENEARVGFIQRRKLRK